MAEQDRDPDPLTDLLVGYPLRVERFSHQDFSVELVLPRSAEELIDEEEFAADERLPYWAELWPSALALTRHLLEERYPGSPAIELGAGIGLPSLALLPRGIDVTATDYYEEALRFARHNAAANGLAPLSTAVLDWRRPTAGLGHFRLAFAADVLYEQRNAESLAELLPLLLVPGGTFLLADPGRVYRATFLDRMSSEGWSVQPLGSRLEPSPAGASLQSTISLFRLMRPV